MKNFILLLLCLFYSTSLLAADPVEVTVLGDRVNLRNANTIESDVVGQANYGQKMQAVSIEDAWVEVLAPADLAVWVYSPLLFEDKEVRAPVLNMRSGPGTQFLVLGELQRGDAVEVLNSLEEWLQIKIPADLTVWISRDLVQIPEAALKDLVETAPEPTPMPTPAPTAIPQPLPTPITIVEVKTVEKIIEVQVTPTPQPKVDAPEGLNLVPLKGQGTLSMRRGQLRAYLLAGSSPSRFVLIRSDLGSDGKTLCYLIGDEEMLKAAAGKTVTVSGHDFWVTGERLPVTKVDKLDISPEFP